ncbi:MAG: methyltransferase domain-containing protein [Phycisphaerales bacterium]|nr:methyltransferase domain-containing protein [Phycisphaerales bacterium]
MLLAPALSLLVLLATPQAPTDPEQTAAGRTHYLGRAIAQTMHWQGAPWLLRATREDEENGTLLRRWLAVQPGQSVCDLGCGNGYHTLPLAKAVGKEGRVFAVDLQPEMLKLLRQRAEASDLANVTLIEATVDDPKLPPASCDLVLLVDVYHELSHPVRVMTRVREALRPGGRVVLVEFRAEDPAVPIKPEHTMTKAQVVREMATHGFAQVGTFDDLPWQHAMAFAVAADAGPRFAPREVVRGFLAAARGNDARVVAPYLTAPRKPDDLPALSRVVGAELHAGADGRVVAALPGERNEVVLACDDEGRWSVEAVRPPEPFARAHGGKRSFVAMQTATGRGRDGSSIDAQAELAHGLGFDGLAWDLGDLEETRRACETRGGDLVSAYGVLDVDTEGATDLDRRLAPFRAAMQALAGGPGMLWLGLRHKGRAPRDAAGDAAAAQLLATLLQDADATGVEIALYPHHGFWLETAEDALRLCDRLDHPRLGLCFNLCHFLRCSDATDPAPILARCRPRLFAVTVNGADLAGEDWRTLIRPLGEGTFELRTFLATLDAIGFDGPVGLQAYGINRPPQEHLAASMAAWRAAH